MGNRSYTRIKATSFESFNQEAQYSVDLKRTHEQFKVNPVTAAVAGGAASGTAGVANAMVVGKNMFEFAALGTQTITAPKRATGGLDINQDQTDNDGIQLGHGILADGKHAYTIGAGGFYLKAKFSIEDVSGTDDLLVGFRKVQAYQANVDDYTDMAALNVNAGDILIETILNNAATVTTDTTQNWLDLATHELQVNVSAAGVVTYLIDGVAPTVTAAFTFDNADVVVPMLFFLNSTDIAGAVILQKWEIGNL